MVIFRLSAELLRARPRARQVRSPSRITMSRSPIFASTASGGPDGIGLATEVDPSEASSSAAKRAMGPDADLGLQPLDLGVRDTGHRPAP